MRAAIPAACLVAALTVFGCDDAPQGGTITQGKTETATPAPTTTEPTTPEETEDPVPAAPELPAEASEDSKAGVEAFANYYVELLSHSFVYKDVEELRAHTLDSCTTCHEWADSYAETGERGGKVVEGDAAWKVTDLIVVKHTPGESARVGVNVTIGKHSYIESADAEPASRPEESFIFTITLSRQDDSWAIEQLTQA